MRFLSSTRLPLSHRMGSVGRSHPTEIQRDGAGVRPEQQGAWEPGSSQAGVDMKRSDAGLRG